MSVLFQPINTQWTEPWIRIKPSKREYTSGQQERNSNSKSVTSFYLSQNEADYFLKTQRVKNVLTCNHWLKVYEKIFSSDSKMATNIQRHQRTRDNNCQTRIDIYFGILLSFIYITYGLGQLNFQKYYAYKLRRKTSTKIIAFSPSSSRHSRLILWWGTVSQGRARVIRGV